jgi:hypothetical protein
MFHVAYADATLEALGGADGSHENVLHPRAGSPCLELPHFVPLRQGEKGLWSVVQPRTRSQLAESALLPVPASADEVHTSVKLDFLVTPAKAGVQSPSF